MRRVNLVIMGVAMCIHAFGQAGNSKSLLFGVDPVTAVTERNAGFFIGHAFAEHWSLGGDIFVGLSHRQKLQSDEETGHYGELDQVTLRERKIEDMFYGEVSVSYWPARSFDGAYFSFGGSCQDSGTLGLQLEIGYLFRIWKIIHADISYKVNLNESYRNKEICGRKTSLGICILF